MQQSSSRRGLRVAAVSAIVAMLAGFPAAPARAQSTTETDPVTDSETSTVEIPDADADATGVEDSSDDSDAAEGVVDNPRAGADEVQKPILSVGDAILPQSLGGEDAGSGEVILEFDLTLDESLGELDGNVEVPFEVAPVAPTGTDWFTVETSSPVTIDSSDTIEVKVDTGELGDPATPAVLTVELFHDEDPGSEPDAVVVAKRFGVGAVAEQPDTGGVVPRHVLVSDAVGTRGGPDGPTPAEFHVVAVPPPVGEELTVSVATADGPNSAVPQASEDVDYQPIGSDEAPNPLTFSADEPVHPVSVPVEERSDADPVLQFALEVADDPEGVETHDGVGRIVTTPDATGPVEDAVGDGVACAEWIGGERGTDACPKPVRDTVEAAEQAADDTEACVNGLTGETSVEECPEEVRMVWSMLRGLLFSVLDTAGQLPEISIEAAVEVLEPPVSGATVSIEVTASEPRAVETTVEWQAQNGTAMAGTDYGEDGVATPPSGTVTFPAGTEPETEEIEIPLIGNDTADGNLEFTVTLEDGGGYTLGDDDATVTIVDDDTITVSIEESVEFDEPAGSGTTSDPLETIVVSMTPEQHSRTVMIPTITATPDPEDPFDRFTLVTSSLNFAPDSDVDTKETASEDVEVELMGDGIYEAGLERAFTVDLGDPQVGSGDPPADIEVTTGQADVTVTDADAAPEVEVTVADQASEQVTFEVARTLPDTTDETALDTTFDYETKPDTAHPPDDYTSNAGSHTFPRGSDEEVSTSIDVPVEPGGTGAFDLVLSDLTGAVFADADADFATAELGVVDGNLLGLAEDDEGGDRLHSFDPAKPGVTTDLGAIGDVSGGHELLAIEFDGDGDLYALARDTADGTPRLYEVTYPADPEAGGAVSATAVPLFPCLSEPAPATCVDDTAPVPELTGTAFDLTWVPSPDEEGGPVLRVAGDDGQHLRIDLSAAVKVTPGLPFRDAADPAGDPPALAGISYSPSVDQGHPLLYGIDLGQDAETLVFETGEFQPPVDPDKVVEDVQEMLPDVPPEGVPPEPASTSSHDDPAGVVDDPTTAPNLLARGATTEIGALGGDLDKSDGTHVGFDVGHDGIAYLTAFDGQRTNLHTVDLGEDVSGERATSRGRIGKPGSLDITDIAVEPAGLVQFERSTASTTEPDSGDLDASLSVIVEREHGATGELTVPYSVDDDFELDDGHSRALEGEGEDFELADGDDDADGVDDGVLTFGDGEATVTVDVTVPGDDDWQGDRQFALELGQPSGAAGLGEPSRVVVTIDDGDPGTLSIDGLDDGGFISVDEGDVATIDVQRTGGSEGGLLVDLVTVEVDGPDGQDREPAGKGDDYEQVVETLAWAPGESGVTSVDIQTLSDSVVEGDEIVDFELTNARLVDEDGNEIADGDLTDHELLGGDTEGTLVIREVDPGAVQFSTQALSIDESDGAEAEVTVMRTGGGSGAITVEWSAQDGPGDSGAKAGTDYEDDDNGEPPSGTLTFGHGDDEESFTIAVLDNDDFDGDRTFTATLEVDDYATEHDGTEPDQLSDLLGDPAEIGITIDDEDVDKTGGEFTFMADADGASQVQVEVREDEELRIPVVRTKAGSGTVEIDWSAHSDDEDTAEAGIDYGSAGTEEVSGTVVFDSKQLEGVVAVPIIDDEEVEGPQTFTVTLDAATFAGDDEPDVVTDVVDPAAAEVTILDIEAVRAYGIAEDESGTDEVVAFNPVLPDRDDGKDAAELLGAIDSLDGDERVEGLTFAHSGGTLHVLGVEDMTGFQRARVYTLALHGEDGPTVEPERTFSVDTADAFGVTFDAGGDLLVATTAGELVVVGSDGVESKQLEHDTSDELPQIGALATAPDGTVYGIDTAADTLVRLGGDGGTGPSPRDGKVTTVADLDVGLADAPAALDVDTDGVVYALVDSDDDGTEELHRVFPADSDGEDAGATRLLASLDDGIAGVSGFSSLAIATAGVLDLDAPSSAAESAGEVEVPVVRSEGTFGAVGASYEIVDDDGQAIDDGTATLDHGETTATITHTWEPSEAYDDDRQVAVRLLDATGGAVLGDDTEATVTIENDNPPPTISAGRDVSVAERGDGATARVRLHLSGATNKTAEVTARTVDGTATAGRDHTALQQTVTFPAGATTRTVDVDIRALDNEAPQRHFQVALSGPVDASIGDTAATITVTRDYPEPPAPSPEPEVKEVVVEPVPPRGNVTPSGDGYWIPSPVGTVEAFGDAAPIPGISGQLAVAFNPEREIVDVASDQTGEGVWLLERSGGVHALGSADYHGSIPERRAQGFPIGTADAASIAATPSGNGYAILDEDGGIHTFGDARYHGSIPQRRAEGLPIGVAETVSIAMTPTGDGYVVLEDNGGVHTFGDARYHGSIPALRLAGVPVGDAELVSIALAPGGDGYWILDEHGGVHTFGEARYHGSIPALQAAGQNIGIAGGERIEATASGEGYWIFDRAGGVFTFGDAPFRGSVPGRTAG